MDSAVTETMARVVIAHTDTLLCDVIGAAATSHGVEVVATTSYGEGIVELCRDESADVLVTEAVLDDGPIEQRLEALRPGIASYVLISEDGNRPEVDTMLARGASGCLLY